MKSLLRCTACALVLTAGAVVSSAQAPADDALMRARTLVEAGKVGEAEKLLQPYTQKHPDSADGHFLLGYVYFREEKARASLAEYTAGARTRRPGADDFRVIASDYVLLGDYADASRWFGEVTRERPADAENWYLLGRAQYNDGHYGDASGSFQQALKLRPQSIEAENNLGLARQAMDDLAGAMEAFRTGVRWQEKSPTDAQPYLNLGSLLTQEGHADQALANLKEAEKLAAKNPKIHEELARAYEALNRLGDAQAELEKAIALAPKASGLHFKLARIFRREGLRQQAQREFDICAQLDSTHSSIETPNPYRPN